MALFWKYLTQIFQFIEIVFISRKEKKYKLWVIKKKININWIKNEKKKVKTDQKENNQIF